MGSPPGRFSVCRKQQLRAPRGEQIEPSGMLGGNEKSAHHTGSWPLYLSCPPWSNISQFLSGRGSQSLPEAALLCSSWSKMLPRAAGICPSLGFISELFSAFCLFALHLRNDGFHLRLFHGRYWEEAGKQGETKRSSRYTVGGVSCYTGTGPRFWEPYSPPVALDT